MYQNKSYKNIIILLSSATLLLFGFIYFAYYQIKEKNENILRLQQDLSAKSDKHEYLISLQNTIKEIESEIEKVQKSIIPKSRDVAFIEDLESMARSYGLQIEIQSLSLVSDKNINTDKIAVLKVKARASGSWSSVYRFVSELESLTYKLKIDKIALYTKSDGSSTINRNADWEVIFEISVLEEK